MYYHTLRNTLTFADNTRSVQLDPELGIYGVLDENETKILPFISNKDSNKMPIPIDDLKFMNSK